MEESLGDDGDEAELMLLHDDTNSGQRESVELRSSSVSTKGLWTFSFLTTLCSQAFFDLHMG